MREQIKSLSKETFIYGLSTVTGRCLNFLLVPFYVNVLRSTAEYGMTTSLYTYIAFLNVIYPLGLEAAFFRYAARGEGEPENIQDAKHLFSSLFLVILGFASILTLMILLLSPWLVTPVFHDRSVDIASVTSELERILQLGAGILFFDSLTVLPFAVLRLQHQAVRFASFRLMNILLTLLLNFVFIVKLHWGVQGIFLANLTGSVFVFCLLLPTILQRLEFRIDPAILKKLIPFGLTNVPAYLSSMMVQVIDRPIVQAFLGLGALGIYQANYRMGTIMMIFVGIFEYAWRPFFMRQFKTNDQQARLIFSRVFTYFMLICLIIFLALSWGLPYLVSASVFGYSLLRKDYWTGLPMIPVILLAYVFQGMYTNFIAGIYIKEHNKVLPYVTGMGVVFNVSANFLLIPYWGMMGAALATLLAYVVMAVVLYREAQKVYFIPYDWPRIRLLTLIIVSAYVMERIFALTSMVQDYWPLFSLRLGLFFCAILALFFFKFFSESELKFLRQIFVRE